jgi:hypothetical protein
VELGEAAKSADDQGEKSEYPKDIVPKPENKHQQALD